MMARATNAIGETQSKEQWNRSGFMWNVIQEVDALSLWHAAGELRAMINLIVIVISAIMFGLLLAWWRWPAFRAWIEAPKYVMLRQERRFDDQRKG
jgi:hypothetical protein